MAKYREIGPDFERIISETEARSLKVRIARRLREHPLDSPEVMQDLAQNIRDLAAKEQAAFPHPEDSVAWERRLVERDIEQADEMTQAGLETWDARLIAAAIESLEETIYPNQQLERNIPEDLKRMVEDKIEELKAKLAKMALYPSSPTDGDSES